MNLKRYSFAPLLLTGILLSQAGRAQTTATNVRLRTDPAVRKVIVEYELPQVLPGDSIYLELETASGRILRPLSVNGDVGTALKPGTTKLIAWDVVRDNVRLDEDVKVLLRVARMVSVNDPATLKKTPPSATLAQTPPKPTTDRVAEPGSVVRKKSPLPIIGWGVTAALTGYATVLALGLNKDVDTYNAKPFADDDTDLKRFQDLKAKIDKNKGTFYIVAGAAAAVAVANTIYTFVVKPNAARRTSLLIRSGESTLGESTALGNPLGKQITSLGLTHTF